MYSQSKAYIEFEGKVSNLRRLSYGMRYLDLNKEVYIKWLVEKKGEIFPEKAFDQELKNTIEMELEVSNILLRTYIERYALEKCGSTKKFFNQYKVHIESDEMEYQRNLQKLPILTINYDLRNYSVHSQPKYDYIQSKKSPINILSESVVRITNGSGQKEIALFHDLDKKGREKLLDEVSRKIPTGNIHYSIMSYGELLRKEVLDCIRQIDLI